MKTFSKIYNALIFAFLYIPIVVLIVFSFNSSKSRTTWHGFSTKWYTQLFNNPELMHALFITITIALLSTVIATIIGTITAIGLNGANKKLKKAMLAVNNIPMINPEIVTGVSLMLMFAFIYRSTGRFQLGYGTLLIAHVTFCIPYVVLQVMPRLRKMNKHMYEAALDLGCKPAKALFKVVLPEIMPGIVTGALMAFTVSLDDFVISLFTAGSTAQNLSVEIYSMMKRRVTPEINALSTLMFGTVLIILVLVNVLQMRELKKK